MSDAIKKEAAPEEKVMIFHKGQGYGPMSTKYGDLLPGNALEVPAAYAATLTRAYKYVVLAKDIIPGGVADKQTAAENAMLKAECTRLNKAVADAPKAEEHEALKAQVTDLQGRLQEFLEAKDKKSLEALQEKHAEAVPV